MGKVLVVLTLVTVGLGGWIFLSSAPPTKPNLDPEEWWGPNELKKEKDNSIRPFKIQFSEEMIKELRQRLKSHRPLTPPLEGVGFQYGFNTQHLNSWISYWADKYDFAAREKFLNQYPQFKTRIQGLDIHFIRVKPQVPANVQVLPLLLVHGWPGSVREFYEIIPLLTKQTPGYNFAFEVIVPSLPGYGFSDPAVRPGLAVPQAAVIMKNLMHRLGFKKYYIQGGDWGAVICSVMATLFPEDILGHHTNMPGAQTAATFLKTIIGAFIPSLVVEPELADRMYPLSKTFSFLIEESGYFHIQATKPDTVGVALSDSPVGLLAYIVEKFGVWTDKENREKPDGGLVSGQKFTKDQILDNLMIYWSTNSITTSMRFYAETLSSATLGLRLDEIQSPVPTWAIQAKHEITYQPPCILKHKYPNLLDATVLPNGGHFLAFEMPETLAKDVFKAVKAFREFHEKNVKTEL